MARSFRNGIIAGLRWLAAVKLLRAAMKAYLCSAPDTVAITEGRMKTMNTWQSFNRGERTPGWHHDQLHLQRGQ